DTAVAPRIAAKKAPPGEHAALEETELAKGVDGVLRAARVVLARAGRSEQPERVPPRVDEPDPCMPHEPAFSRTASISATSQSFPRVSAGSATPGRAGRT